MVAGCVKQAEQTNTDATPAPDVFSSYQVEQEIQGIAIENIWAELLETCNTYIRVGLSYPSHQDMEDGPNLSPNCFLKAGEICNTDNSTDIQYHLLIQRLQNIRQTACSLWQPYDQKIWQEDSYYSHSRYHGPCYEVFAYYILSFSYEFDTISEYEDRCEQRELNETQSSS